MMNGWIKEQAASFSFLGCGISYVGEFDVFKKIDSFNKLNGAVERVEKWSSAKDIGEVLQSQVNFHKFIW